jgi:transcription initiation factor IIE alpha subunit
MADMTNGTFNILYHERMVPHTDASLMAELKYTRNKYADFMKRLYKKSVISYIHTVLDGKECKYIMLNPNLARKRKTIDKTCLAYFDKLENKIEA